MKIGVLALQGDFKEHIDSLKRLNTNVIEVRLPEDLEGVQGLIIPGGESTTIGKLIVKYGLDKAITDKKNEGMAIYGTCAGAILLAKDIVGSDQPRLGLLDIKIERNAYGRQIDSFETELEIKGVNSSFRAIFIRAPIINGIRDGVEILARHGQEPVMIRKDKVLASTFHPELTKDTRVHELFLNIIKS